MPSWDEDTSDASLVSGFSEGHDISPRGPVPDTIFDPDYNGSDDVQLRCKHDKPLHKFVAFEGSDTGRKFLGCGCKEGMCDTFHWVDLEWPPTLQKALIRLWGMYEEEKDTRISGNVEYATANYQLVLEKKELEQEKVKLMKELSLTLPMSELGKIKTHELELEKARKEKAMAQVSTLKEEKKKLEYCMGDLFKALQEKKEKLKQISELCAE
uniref:Uncharacterized protein n=1 Tax=Avena sativa TaxID=4498 RepID=A0ACD5WU87_AVESA